MLYRELVQFDPIESIIQLHLANNKQEAAQLIETYVVSDRMADLLANLVFPQLQLDRPVDNKGVLIVGNYGTGKSHLLAMLSALAEHADLLPLVRNSEVSRSAESIAGKFKVVRAEIGGVKRSLRDIVLSALEDFFDQVDTPYKFPPADQLTNNKGPLTEALGLFSQRYPGTGVLFVVDEMLDYLHTREERALFLDLGFLRELGEIAATTPFRFMAGLQESLFDSPRFAFVAEQLRRVRDRFEQVRIAREDIAYVVSERLLQKSDEQLALITEHLRKFTRLYPAMAERLGEYARLFPIHPAYIETFEYVYVAEKREVMKTFSTAIRTVLDKQVPMTETGLISYDHYWNLLKDNPSLRGLPGVADVIDKSNVLEGRIQNAYTRKQLLPIATRIIHALSVHRLTTSDLHAPLGVTAEELRDQLCLWVAMPEADADFLSGQVQVALKEIMRTVSGQYISYNDGNGQYFLDIKKDIDFDAKIAERGRFLEERDLNRYFYAALRQLLNLSDTVHTTGFLIWPYELPWTAKNVNRPGYLFFGPPNERSTAQPARDFYLYLLPPFGGPSQKLSGQADEVILQLQGLGSDFEEIVRKYAGAQAMAGESPNHRQTYADKADAHLRSLMVWLRDNFNGKLRVTYQGVTRTVPEVLAQTRSSASRDAEELLRLIAAHLLAPHFGDAYPEYPAFTRLQQPISEQGRANSAMDAVRFIARGMRTNLAIGVLDGLKLLDQEEHIKPLNSPYARYLLDMLQTRGENQVVNQGEIIGQVASGVVPIYKDHHFKLEPEWIAVVLLALVYSGDITLAISGNDVLDAGNIDRAATKAIDELTDFRFIRRPKTLPLSVWTQIFEALGLQSSLMRDEATREGAVRELQQRVQQELQQVVEWQSRVQGGLTLWNQPLFTDLLSYKVDTRNLTVAGDTLPSTALSQTELLPYLRKTKEFLETLQRFNTPGKLRNLQLATADVGIALGDRTRSLRIKDLLDVVAQLQPATAYLSEAAAVLPGDHTWVGESEKVRDELVDAVRRLAKGEASVDVVRWRSRLDALRRQYQQIYADLHRQYVLGPSDDDRRKALLRDPRVDQLKTLSGIDILNTEELRRWGQLVIDMPVCRDFHPGLLDASPTCPVCRFRPVQVSGQTSAAQRLHGFEQQLEKLEAQWHSALRENLQSNTAQESVQHMTPTERKPVQTYLESWSAGNGALPPGLVDAANQALRGLKTVPLHMPKLMESLQAGGLPCTLEQLTQRFNGYMREVMSGHDQRNTRIMIDVDSVQDGREN